MTKDPLKWEITDGDEPNAGFLAKTSDCSYLVCRVGEDDFAALYTDASNSRVEIGYADDPEDAMALAEEHWETA